MTNYNHLSIEQRDVIQHLLNQNKTLTYIGDAIGVDRTTISKEIRRNRYIKTINNNIYDPFDTKAIENAISKCKRLTKYPYVCNTCEKKNYCLFRHLYYNSKTAQERYKYLLKTSREGINISLDQIDEIENIIVPLIRDKKQSVNQVYINHNDILTFCKTTFYTYVNNNIISLKNIDLPKKVKYKKRKVRKHTNYKKDLTILKGRKYEDYLEFISKHPNMNKVQLDTVIGMRTNKKTLLTMYIVDTHFMLIFLLNNKTSQNVSEIFKTLKNNLGYTTYRKVFRIILTDNGPEFYNPYEMEMDYENCKKLTNVFYCHPYASYEKHELEVNHEYIRRVLPKGSNFSKLEKYQIKKLQDNINNIPRNSLNGKTPYELTKEKYPDLIEKLDCKYIKPDDVNLSKEYILKGENK